ncbi:phage tail tape measure protein [uncultured Draconibacterium sp.]|uniref:phage tail tape measure protein n=1 Tax=uncultured Draconibacterium sp. TaxID=1573823 RepID=UPI0025F3E989|nr:phage tail tape measure protein [uncultured Draconibacterium sp.]
MANSYNRRINLYINGKEVKNNMRSISAEFSKAKGQIRNMTRGSKEYNLQMRKIKSLKKIVDDHNKSLGRTSSIWQKTKNLFAQAGIIGGVGALVSVFRNAAQVSTEFSKEQSNLAAVLGKTKDDIRELTNDAIRYGSITKFTAGQVTQLQTEFAKLGFTETQIQASTKAALDLAAATNAELGPAAKVTGVALKAFNMSATHAGEVAASLAVATSKSALSFEDFETILSTVGPVASAFGFTLEDTLALTGKLKDAGFDASSAATATRNIILNLADSNGALAKTLGEPIKSLDDLVPALADLQAKGVDLNTTLQLTDKRSVSAFNAFLTAADSTLALRDGLQDVEGELQNMVDTQLDNLSGDITLLNSAWQGFILSIENGDGVISKFVRGSVKFLTDALIKLSNVDLVFKRAKKFSEEDMERVYDAMINLSGSKYRAFQKIVEAENKLTLEQIELNKNSMIQQIKDTGQSQREAEMLWDEFYKRRLDQDEKARQLQIDEEKSAQEKAEKERLLAAQKEAEKIAEARKKSLAISEFIEADMAKQKEAIQKYFAEAGEGAFDAFIAAIEKSQKEKTIDFSLVPEMEAENEEFDPTADYAIQQYQQTLEFKTALNESMYEQGLIGEQEYQDRLTELTRQGEQERLSIKQDNIEKARQFTDMSANFVTALMDLELEKAGDNEEKKKEIRKKYADAQFAVTAATIIADTAAAIMKAYAQLGPIGGAIASGLLGATGLVQLAVANKQRQAVKGFSEGGYTGDGGILEPAGIVHKGEYVVPKSLMSLPAVVDMVSTIETMRTKPVAVNSSLTRMYSEGGYTSNNGATPESPSESKNADIQKLQDSVSKLHHTVEILSKKKHYVAIEMVQKKLQKWEEIEALKGM